MLRNVLADYVDSFRNEREMDAPILTLLKAMGFIDIHFTHGSGEFGKDYIAKRLDEGTLYQYAIQSKHGDIGQGLFRRDIQPQLLEAVMYDLSHPSFDVELPRKVVLVLSGRLTSNAALSLQSFNDDTVNRLNRCKVDLWDRETLIDLLLEFGPETIHSITAASLKNYGSFFNLYGQSIRGEIDEYSIEEHFTGTLGVEPRQSMLLVSMLESQVLASRCARESLYYEEFYCYLANLRSICYEIAISTDPAEKSELMEILNQQEKIIENHAIRIYEWLRAAWEEEGRDLAKQVGGPAVFVSYPITCQRFLEISCIAYLYCSDLEKKKDISSFITAFVQSEPGASHPVSDRYAVSALLSILIQISANENESAKEHLRKLTVWLCDRYEEGMGLPSLVDSPRESLERLLGYPFETINIRSSRTSFLAAALGDIAAFLGDPELYSLVINDMKACSIVPQYFQVQTPEDTFDLNGLGVLQYSNVEFEDSLIDSEGGGYAGHVRHELKFYAGSDVIPPRSYMAMAIFLKDRYYPSLWSEVIGRTVLDG